MIPVPASLASLKGMAPRYLDNNFWIITTAQAKVLAGGRLPKPGYEYTKVVGQERISVMRTVTRGRVVWAVLVQEWSS